MKGWRQSAGILLTLVVLLASCSGPGLAAPRGVSEGNQARDFTLETLDGGHISLSEYRGQVVLLNFWATWCPPCRAEIPTLEAAYRARQEDGFVVLGINAQESRQQIAPFVDDMGITYPVLLDANGQVLSDYRARGLPMSLLVDCDGVIRVRHMGYLTAEQLDSYLAQVMP